MAAEVLRDDCRYESTRAWTDLRDCSDELRVAHMAARYLEIAGLVDALERDQALVAIIREEYSCDEATLRAFTIARLRAWNRLAEEQPTAAHEVADAYERVFAKLPGELDFRRAMTIRAVLPELQAAEQMALLDLAPGMRRFMPEERRVSASPSATPAAPAARPSKDWLHRLLRLFGRDETDRSTT